MRRATRIVALLAIVGLVAASCGSKKTPPAGSSSPSGPVIKVGLAFDLTGRGDKSFNDAAAAGLDKAKQEVSIESKEVVPNPQGTDRGELLTLLSQQGYTLNICVGFLWVPDCPQVALKFPDIKYADVDGFVDHTSCEGCKDLTEDSNFVSLLFAEEQGSFLVGAAAALKSQSNHIAFMGGVDIALIHKFQAGYEAGAKFIKPDIQIDVKYLTVPPDFNGFRDPAKGKEAAVAMYQGGADVVYHAAGLSGTGLFTAAKEAAQSSGKQVWAIGVDSDQYLTAPPDEQPYILTSMLKHVDVAVYDTIKAFAAGQFKGGYQTFDLAKDGVGYSTSGGFIDDIKTQLEDLKAKIISGEIKVPTS
jgi:basic membrane protein A and related proteins